MSQEVVGWIGLVVLVGGFFAGWTAFIAVNLGWRDTLFCWLGLSGLVLFSCAITWCIWAVGGR